MESVLHAGTLRIHTYFILAELRCDIVNYRPSFFHRFMRPSREALAFYLVEPETNARQAMWQSFLTGVKKRKLLSAHLAHYKDFRCSAVLGLKKFFRSKLRVSTVSFSSSLSLLELLRHHCYLPENFTCNLKFFEGDNFSDSHFYQIFESWNFRFLLLWKKAKLGRWKVKNSISEKSYMNGTVI